MSLKISNFIIGLIVIGIIVTGIVTFMSGLNAKYDVSFDNSSLEVYQDLEDIHNLTEEIEAKTRGDDALKSDSTDILGGFFSQAYRVMRITWGSMTTFNKMTDASFENVNVGNEGFSQTLRSGIISIVVILIILGIIISALVKRDL